MHLDVRALGIAAHHLAQRDSDLARLLNEDGVPPLWDRQPGYSTLIHIILEQQVSLASARAVFNRVQEGIQPLTPIHVIEAGAEVLRTLGLTRQKARYCVHAAHAMASGSLDLDALDSLEDAEAMAILTEIKGIGPWTATIYLLMVMLRPDVWPPGDIALNRTVRKIKKLPDDISSKEISEVAEQWAPYRSVAARMLWHHYLSGSGV